ncbi:MAG: Rieske (2Fe-2S) protein [Pseudonocardia sp.]
MTVPEVTVPEVTAHRLGLIAEIPVGEGRAYAVGSEQVAVFRLRDGTLRAMQAICPHAGGPLADGHTDATTVICPLHNHVFALADGACTNGDYTVRVFPVRDENGQVVIDI